MVYSCSRAFELSTTVFELWLWIVRYFLARFFSEAEFEWLCVESAHLARSRSTVAIAVAVHGDLSNRRGFLAWEQLLRDPS